MPKLKQAIDALNAKHPDSAIGAFNINDMTDMQAVMFDGSALPFDENVRCTREVVRMAHARGVLVEAEIGRLPGREESSDVAASEALRTDPDEAKAFWDQTGADLLAISFGTELKHTYTAALRESLARQEKEIDPRKILVHARDAIQKAVEGRRAVLATPRAEQPA